MPVTAVLQPEPTWVKSAAPEQDTVVLTEALELSHLDYEEFLAAYESMTLALSSHLRELVTYREAR